MTQSKRFFPESRPRSAGKKRLGYGRYADNRLAFAKTAAGTIALYRLNNDPEEAESEEEREIIENSEIGPNYKLTFSSARRNIDYYLTSLTEDELDSIKSMFEFALELAYPIVRERDRMAQDAFSDGDDSFSRIYRQSPQFVVRNREITEHDQGLLERSRAAFDRNRYRRDSNEGSGVSGPLLAAGEPSHSEAQDDKQETDEPEDLCQMVGSSSDVPEFQGTDTSGNDSTPPA